MSDEYCQLARLSKHTVELFQEGLGYLEEYDDAVVITLHGELTQDNFHHREDAIWISRYPHYNHEIKRYLVILRITGSDEPAKALGNRFCTFISTANILANYDRADLSYVSLNEKWKENTAALIGVAESYQGGGFTQNTREFKDALTKNRVDFSGYPSIDGIQCPALNSQERWDQLVNSIKDILLASYGSSELTHGYIIMEYAQNLANQQKSRQSMDPKKAEGEIEIDEEFEEYLEIIGAYNNRCKGSLGNESHPQIDFVLSSAKQEVEGSSLFKENPHYAARLQKYMLRKETELKELNEKYQDSQNLRLLHDESNSLLQKVKRKKENSKEEVDRDLQGLIGAYGVGARGANKDRLLSDFLQVFTPTLYEEAGINEDITKKLKSVNKENTQLEEEIRNLQKKNEKCCSLM